MSQLPTGTVTFLFTDIEGSTRLLQRLGASYTAVLGEHRDLMRTAFARCGGHEVDTQGDAFFAAFTRAADAVACAVEAQLALARHAWPEGAARALEALATVAAVRGHAERSVRLLGAAARLRDELGASPHPLDRALIERTVDTMRARLGAEAFAALWETGRTEPWERAVAAALQAE